MLKQFAMVTSLLVASIALADQLLADEWPQWMGPQRDNVWRETGLLEKFPEQGPTILWRTKIAGGYTGPAVTQEGVFVTDYVTSDNVKVPNFQRQTFSGMERVLCLDAETGQQKWKHEYPVKYSLSYPAGPRCTPLVHEGKLYTLGAEGNLNCLEADSGKIIWFKDLKAEYNTKTALWGYCNHPLIDGNRLICIVGGQGSHVVAFDKDNGEELWRAQSASEQGYSPPTIINAGGVRQLILLTPDFVAAVNPDDGDEYWSVPYSATNGSIIMSPVRWKNYLYAAGYSQKNLMLELAKDEPDADVMWQDRKDAGLSPVNVQPFVEDGVIYGFDQSGILYAVDVPSGDRLWQTTAPIGPKALGTGTAFLVKQADRFWMFNELGEIVIAKLSREGYEEVDRAKIIEPTNVAFGRDVVWCMPAFANKRLYVRNDKECICVDLAQ